MKGLILSGGYGTRLRPSTYSQQKQLIPVANKPILFYAIEALISAGIKKIGIVIGPNKDQVINLVRSKEWDAKIDFIYQDEPMGIAHAVKVSKDYLGQEPFVLYLGDNILMGDITKYIKKFEDSDNHASILLSHVENPQMFGVAKLNSRGEIVKLIEKPKIPPSDLALVGIYIFKKHVFEAIENIKFSWRNQLEITDAIQWLIDRDYKVKSSIVEHWWVDTGKPEDILDANRMILDNLKHEIIGSVDENVKIKGRVKIDKNTKIVGDSSIKGPCIIGEDCIIEDSYIGPYTSIGNGCKIIESEIEDSVIMSGVEIIKAKKIIDSLIGREVKIKRVHKIPNGLKLILGDKSEAIL